MIKLEVIGKDKEHILYNLMQKYLYEMNRYYDEQMDANGNFEYKYLPYYFTESDRKAYFIYNNSDLIGFALVNTHSFTGEMVDNCIAEFTVFPSFRNQGYGVDAIDALMKVRPGSWQLKYSMDNKSGMAFWKKICEKYNGTEAKLEGKEIVLTIR